MKHEILRPSLLIDKGKCINNIHKMSNKARRKNLIFRPHFKTHQSQIIGEWFRDAGVSKITVSSVSMAEYFSAKGWKDITIAFPVNIRESDQINSLSAKIDLNLLVADVQTIDLLQSRISSTLGVFIELDTGYNRSGIEINSLDEIKIILNKISHNSFLKFRGFLIHAGDTYNAKKSEDIIAVHKRNLMLLSELRKIFISDWPDLIISIGDTPSCSVAEDFKGIDEIRPGNFVFFDLMQQNIGSCSYGDIAVIVACPVVSVNRSRYEIVLYGGGIHLSKEYITDKTGNKIFGKVVIPDNELMWGSPVVDTFLADLSQEHGIIKMNSKLIDSINIGDLLGVLPVHSCLTANLMRGYLDQNGNTIDHLMR